jgi:hypothetical protein
VAATISSFSTLDDCNVSPLAGGSVLLVAHSVILDFVMAFVMAIVTRVSKSRAAEETSTGFSDLTEFARCRPAANVNLTDILRASRLSFDLKTGDKTAECAHAVGGARITAC